MFGAIQPCDTVVVGRAALKYKYSVSRRCAAKGIGCSVLFAPKTAVLSSSSGAEL